MASRSTVVLHGSYADAFIGAAIANKDAVVLCDRFTRSSNSRSLNERYRRAAEKSIAKFKRNPRRAVALQMFLLYEKVIVVTDTDPYLDVANMIDTTGVEVVSPGAVLRQRFGGSGFVEDESGLFFRDAWDRVLKPAAATDSRMELNDYAVWMGPIVIESYMRKRDSTLDALIFLSAKRAREYRFSKRMLYDIVFRSVFDQVVMDSEADDIRRVFERLASDVSSNWPYVAPVKHADALDGVANDLEPLISWLDPEGEIDVQLLVRDPSFLLTLLGHQMTYHIAELMTILEMSNDHDALLLQSRFDMDELQADRGVWGTDATDSHAGALQTLRLNYEEIIGTLPRLGGIDDALRLKNQRGNDIRRLREVLDGVEAAVREGDQVAVQRAGNEIRLASADLARGNTAVRVNKWLAYMAVPTSVLAFISFPAALASFGVTLIGAAATFRSDFARRRSEWLNVVR